MFGNLRRRASLVPGFHLSGGKGKPHKKNYQGTDQAKWLHLGVLDREILRRHCNLLAGVAHDLVWFAFGQDTYSMVLADENNLKAALTQHSRKLSFAFTDCQSLLGFVPMELNRGVRALFVVVAIVLILV